MKNKYKMTYKKKIKADVASNNKIKIVVSNKKVVVKIYNNKSKKNLNVKMVKEIASVSKKMKMIY